MNNAFINLILLQLRDFVREPETLFWSLAFPILLSCALGFAFANKGNETYRVAIISNAYRSANSSLQTLQSTPDDSSSAHFTFVTLSQEEAFLKLKRGEVSLLIEPKPENALIYRYDLQNEEAQKQYLLLEKRLSSATAKLSTISAVRTQGSRYIDFLIPGMLALGIMQSCIWGIGWSLIDLRIKKLLRRMVATPMSKTEFLLAHFVVRLILSFIESVALFIFAYLLFDVRLQGSSLALFTAFLATNVAFGGIGVLVASRPTKAQVGSGIVNAVTLSLTILSGIFFSYTNFPDVAASVIRFLPLTLAADALRGVFNEGLGIVDISRHLLVLSLYGLSSFLLGLRWFRWY